MSHAITEFLIAAGLYTLIASLAIFALAASILMFVATLIKKAENHDRNTN